MTDEDRAKHRALAAKRRQQWKSSELWMEFDGFDLVVRGDYQPEEKATQEYPGCPEDFEVLQVYLRDSAVDIADLFDAPALRIAALEEIHRQEEIRLADAAEAAANRWEIAA